MKLQWKSVSEEQERRNSRLRDYRSLIGGNRIVCSRTPDLIGPDLISHFVSAEKDVNRTDRTNRFYEGIDNPGLVLLHDILMTYCMYDFDLGEAPPPRSWPAPLAAASHGADTLHVLPAGYVQGMSDLLSPILYVMENEVDAFWCFVSFMDQMVSSGGVEASRSSPTGLWTCVFVCTAPEL